MQSLNLTYGALLVSLIISSALYGITVLQTFIYYRRYPNDPWLTKLTVFLLWVLDTTHLVFCTITLYTYLITNFNSPGVFLLLWSMNLQIDCNGLIGLIAQCFFARRVLMMTGHIIPTVLIIGCGLTYFGLGILLTVKSFAVRGPDDLLGLRWIIAAGLGSAAAADIIIAATLCYHLLKSRTGFARTDSLISTLIAYCITTGLVTSVIAVACVITFEAAHSTYIWIGLFWIIGRCYVNSVLAALNIRVSLREKMIIPQSTFLHASALNPPPSFNSSSADGGRSKKTDHSVLEMNTL